MTDEEAALEALKIQTKLSLDAQKVRAEAAVAQSRAMWAAIPYAVFWICVALVFIFA